jgi:hypothetical protein
MQKFANIANLRNPTIEQLRRSTADFENHIYKNAQTTQADISGIQSQITALSNQVAALTMTQFPGFGTDHLHAAFGDHTHIELTFFSKSGSQAASAGTSSIVFDSTKAFSSIPIVSVWTIDTDPFGLNTHIAKNITVTGFDVDVDVAGTIYYLAVGLR